MKTSLLYSFLTVCLIDASLSKLLCPKLMPPANGTVVVKNLTAVYTCGEGYHIDGPKKLYCIEEELDWDDDPPDCVEDTEDEYDNFGGAGDEYDSETEEEVGTDDICNNGLDDCDHICKMVNKKPKCFCNPGFALDPSDEKSCIDIDECKLSDMNCKYGCTNLPGTYECKKEFETTTKTLNEQEKEDSICKTFGCSHGCIQDEEPECTCPDGFDLDDNERNCIDINECTVAEEELSDDYESEEYEDEGFDEDKKRKRRESKEKQNKLCSHECVNTLGSFFCKCPDGMSLGKDVRTCIEIETIPTSTTKYQFQEVDTNVSNTTLLSTLDNNELMYINISECKDIPPKCSKTCNIVNGSYVCSCNNKLYLLKGNITCENFNACSSDHGCSHDCLINGTFDECICPTGLTLGIDNKTCEALSSVNECLLYNGNCSHMCVSQNGTFHCECFDGFKLKNDSKSCELIDGCTPNLCSQICIFKDNEVQCECSEGYILGKDQKICEDIDECEYEDESINVLCSDKCVNTPGSYHCECLIGYELDSSKSHCIDINECNSSVVLHECSHDCVNTLGGYQCDCPLNYILEPDNNKTCMYNYCSSNVSKCSHDCELIGDGYICKCPSNMSLSEDLMTCTVIEKCEINNGGCSHNCSQEDDGVVCSCPLGFIFDKNSSKMCVDMNSCSYNNGNCSNMCQDVGGSVMCTCPDNLILVDGTMCLNNPCNLNNGGCSQICNVIGNNSRCSCKDKYILSPTNKSECVLYNPCNKANGGCSHNCSFINDTQTCSCPDDSFKLNSDNLTCIMLKGCDLKNGGCSDICQENSTGVYCSCPPGKITKDNKCVNEPKNECENKNGGCSHICSNINNTAVCSCPPDYQLSMIYKTKCELIDLCAQHNGGCSHICLTQNNQTYCECPEHYVFLDTDKKTCKRLKNDCAIDNGGCSDICSEVNSAVVCDCYDGYGILNDNMTCMQDISPCNVNNGGCSDFCTDLGEMVLCECLSGWILVNNTICVKQNPCMIDNGGCSQVCNYDDDIMCSCDEGYVLNSDRYTCDDINECDSKEAKCAGKWIDFNGSDEYTCGFQLSLDNITCVDPNKCIQNIENYYHSCHNTLGSYYCTCHVNLTLEKSTVFNDVDYCKIDNGGCSQKCQNIGEISVCSCYDGYYLNTDNRTCMYADPCDVENGGCSQICVSKNSSAICSCYLGHILNEDGYMCDDINECVLGIANCSNECVNNVGGFTCTCPDNHILMNNETCVRINPCDTNNGGCSHTCVSDIVGFHCDCPTGYTLDRDNKKCVDVNECILYENVCNSTCQNTIGSYRCLCDSGYNLSKESNKCVDVNECNDKNSCDHKCNNTQGSFICSCFEGYSLDDDKKTCSDIDECQSDIRHCSHQCKNTPGRYTCSCPVGFQLDGSKKNCIDVDECLYYDCSHICANSVGSYECKCYEGYQLSSDGVKCVDINECEINNGGCSHYCENSEGGFLCDCQEGYNLDNTNLNCILEDLCTNNNGGCSQICKMENGDVSCSCEIGYSISDFDDTSCDDIDECTESDKDLCEHNCVNLNGTYTCECIKGYYADGRQCVDINECETDENSCHHSMKCVNTQGSFECVCEENYIFSSDESSCIEPGRNCSPIVVPKYGIMKCNPNYLPFKTGTQCQFRCERGYKLTGPAIRQCNSLGEWDGDDPVCIPQPCPRLIPPDNGHFVPSSCMTGKTVPSEYCSLVCRSGYRPKAARILTCTHNNMWTPHNLPVTCIKHTVQLQPFIRCPANMVVNLKTSEREALVQFPRPKSNMDWWRFIDADPEWAKELRGRLEPGETDIIFKVRNGQNTSSESCKFTITVKDIEDPIITYCPRSFEVRLKPGESAQKVYWNEPQFKDNTGIHKLHVSKKPGDRIGDGLHHIDYIASDRSGNQAHCHFTINVITAEEDIDDNHHQEKYIYCPGNPPRKYHPSYYKYLLHGCTIHWREEPVPVKYDSGKYKSISNRNRNDVHLRHYDRWNHYPSESIIRRRRFPK